MAESETTLEEFEQLDKGLQQIGEQYADLDSQVKARRSLTEDGVRSFVTKSVVIAYAGYIALVIGGYLITAANAGASKEMMAAAADVVERQAMPILTLVLGYYFGSSRN